MKSKTNSRFNPELHLAAVPGEKPPEYRARLRKFAKEKGAEVTGAWATQHTVKLLICEPASGAIWVFAEAIYGDGELRICPREKK